MKTLEISQMEFIQGGDYNAECRMQMGLGALVGGAIGGGVGFLIGAGVVYLRGSACDNAVY